MACVAGNLANVIDVIHHSIKGQQVAIRLTAWPVGMKLPFVQHRSDHTSSLDDQPKLLIGELAVTTYQRAAIIVAGQHRTAKHLQRLEEAGIGAVREVQDD